MSVRDLVVTVVEEFARYYQRAEVEPRPPAPEELETVWRPGRDDSLIGWRAARTSLYDGDVVRAARSTRHRARS
jgi:hypothetical protein